LVRELLGSGVPTTCVEVAPRAYGSERAHLRRVAREVGAGILHTHGSRVDVVDGLAARRLGLGTVSTLHGFTGGGPKNRFYEWLQIRAVRRLDAVVAVSRPMAQRLLSAGVLADRLWTVPNAWSPGDPPLERSAARALLGVPADGFRVGWVGRLSAEKGPDVLFEALPFVADLPVSVSMVGDGPQQAQLQARARGMGFASRITWHGSVRDAGDCMRAFDAFVLSSRTEGTPIALFEAIAAEVPVVVTAVGGVPAVVTSREALLVPPESPEALAAALRDVYEDTAGARRRARGAAARVAEHFGLDPWLDAYERIYLATAPQVGRRASQ
jgi:glycosyltransferase involved in cell wall biosynthesis